MSQQISMDCINRFTTVESRAETIEHDLYGNGNKSGAIITRLEKIEQTIPTLATKADVKEAIQEVYDEKEEEQKRKGRNAKIIYGVLGIVLAGIFSLAGIQMQINAEKNNQQIKTELIDAIEAMLSK